MMNYLIRKSNKRSKINMNLENRYMENELGIKDLVILAQKDIEGL